jgi:hypothetical protein
LEDGSGLTSILPPEMRASSIDEVSYIIRVTDGEPLFHGSYEHGVNGYQRVFEIHIEDALTGEVLETLATLDGKELAGHYYIDPDEIPDAIYGRLPDNWKMLEVVYETLTEFWLEYYENVVFYDGTSTTRYYGTGNLEIPAVLGIKKMFNNGQGELAFNKLVIPSGVEIVYNPRWKDVIFVVAPNSLAEEYCEEHDMIYEYIDG